LEGWLNIRKERVRGFEDSRGRVEKDRSQKSEDRSQKTEGWRAEKDRGLEGWMFR